MLNLPKIRDLLDKRLPGHAMPQGLYTDPDVFEFDLAAIYGRSWIMAGFEIEVPQPGNYLSVLVGRSPIVILRDRAGGLRGFHNSCRHRGAQICELGTGRSSRLTCPYHQWTYDLEGKLLFARNMPEDFDRDAHGLLPIHVETVAGSIYVCLAEEAPDFAPFREHFEPLLAPHDLNNAKLAFQGTLLERGNWKLVMENARECYHCSAKHPELWKSFRDVSQIDYDSDEAAYLNDFRAKTGALGLPIGPVEGDWWQAQRFPLNEGHTSLSMDGKPVVDKTLGHVGDGDVGSLRWAIEPHSFCHAVGDHLFMFSAMPTGPQETIVTSKWLVNKDAVEGVDYTIDRLTELWSRTNDQDRELVENNQRGVNALGYRPGPYSPKMEPWVQRFTDWYCTTARGFVDTNG